VEVALGSANVAREKKVPGVEVSAVAAVRWVWEWGWVAWLDWGSATERRIPRTRTSRRRVNEINLASHQVSQTTPHDGTRRFGLQLRNNIEIQLFPVHSYLYTGKFCILLTAKISRIADAAEIAPTAGEITES
jgi:hypothetical protein